MKRSITLVVLIAVCLVFSGCTASQCNIAQKTMATAQVGYDRASASGSLDAKQKHRWTLEAAQAMAAIWCAEVPVE